MEKQVVEYAGVPVGITVPEGDRVKFIAVKFPVIDLDGGTYRNVSELQNAIHRHMQNSPGDQALFAHVANSAGFTPERKVFNAA